MGREAPTFGRQAQHVAYPHGGGGVEPKRHPPTHRLTNTKENIRENILGI